MPIKIDNLKPEDIGRRVEYHDRENRTKGVIEKWNNRYIFVRYGTSINALATRAEDLDFVEEETKLDMEPPMMGMSY